MFMNPPYNVKEGPCRDDGTRKQCERRGWHTDVLIPGIAEWVARAVSEVRSGRRQRAVGVLPVRSDTKWWQEYVLGSVGPDTRSMGTTKELYFIPSLPGGRYKTSRLHFGDAKQGADFPSAIVVWELP